jgi:phage baseplate assembly protein W
MNYTSPAIDPTDPYGTDLALDENGDLMLTTQGDVALSTQLDNVLQMIRVRLQTMPDTYLFGSDLGSELHSMIDAPLNPQNKKLIENYVIRALQPDPRIVQVNVIDITDPDDGSMQLHLTLNATVIGYGNVQTTVPIGGVGGV